MNQDVNESTTNSFTGIEANACVLEIAKRYALITDVGASDLSNHLVFEPVAADLGLAGPARAGVAMLAQSTHRRVA